MTVIVCPDPTDPPQVQILCVSSASRCIHTHKRRLILAVITEVRLVMKEEKKMACEMFGYKGSFCRFSFFFVCVKGKQKKKKKKLMGRIFSVFVDCKCQQQFHDLPMYSSRQFISSVIRSLHA